ncbi:MAG: sulfatase-like hydrolase/transferase [Thermoleophilaceae bacterium]|nr:sulfatase-like hydrolase/transferase [Thermoleophilaceae bacterium]
MELNDQGSQKPRRPNLLLVITDQQRAPMHWPDEPGWLDALTPADAELRRTGVNFTNACTATSMCSPSRASFLTGTHPSRHGVTLTLTEGDLHPHRKNFGNTLREATNLVRHGEAPVGHVAKTLARGGLRLGGNGGDEPELPAGIATIGSRLLEAGYSVGYKGKWHLTMPLAGDGEWGAADAERVEREFGFPGWVPPDAGENVDPEGYGGGNAGLSGEGWDEDYTQQAERFLADADLPEPFCLVVSLINPHDVIGFPSAYRAGGYLREQFADLDIDLPATVDENLRDKPTAHAITKLGQTAYLGGLNSRQQKLDYVRFYAHLHRLVDEKIGRLMKALGDADDPNSLRSRTVVARFSDHGEMGLSHGGLRQKMFNAYEETIRVPLIVSNPVLFPSGRESAAAVSLVDVVPTLLGLAGAPAEGTIDGKNLCGVLAKHAAAPTAGGTTDFSGVLSAPPESAVREHSLFTFDDHQAGTAQQDTVPHPNRIRCVRGDRWKYAVYLDPSGRAAPEHELYDLEADPDEAVQLVDKSSGVGRNAAARAVLPELREALTEACQVTAMDSGFEREFANLSS